MAAVVAATLLVGHFALTVLHVGPLNPLKVRVGYVAQGWLAPYFEQTWTLFAPDPIAHDRGLLARARCSDGRETPWQDITSPYVRIAQEDRFFPPRYSRLVSNGMSIINGSDPLAHRIRERAEQDTQLAKGQALAPSESLTPAEREFRSRGTAFLTRYATLELDDDCAGRVREVQLRAVNHVFPGFSERDRWWEIGPITHEDLPWAPAPSLALP